jgi:environmental stress-induced protein Ves
MSWRNGGGVTHELVRRPEEGEFDWRLSVAEVAADGPFSSFPGRDRILVLLSDAGMDLHVRGSGAAEAIALRWPFAVHRFPGEATIDATLPDGPTTDLNLMWRRDRFDATVRRLDAPFDLAPRTGATLLAFVAGGAPELAGGTTLASGDVVECADILHVDGSGTLLVFALVPR